MQLLNRSMLPSLSRETVEVGPQADYPVKALQFGEGNFLRAFIDWMIDKSNEAGVYGGSVQMVQLLPQGMADAINEQQGLYTLILRGMEQGKATEYKRVITCVKGCLKAESEWAQLVESFCLATLETVYSNTTEAGIEYKAEPYTPGAFQKTFPAKVTSLLFERFKANRPGLLFVPCELIDKNGAKLKEYVLQYAEAWALGADFARYVGEECNFVNTLVDRIVAGYPRAEAAGYCAKLGYQDNLLDCGEIFHLFVIEGAEKFRKQVPFAEAGLNLVWTDNQTPYRSRKVRFLNGGHTSSVLAAYLAGFDLVDRMTADPLFGSYLRKALFEEVFPTIDLPEADKKAFAESIIDRFLNPFANHQLLSISLNSISKWQVRVLPSLLDYQTITGKLPPVLTFSLAALLAFYRGTRKADASWVGKRDENIYPISDDADKIAFINQADTLPEILGRVDFWGQDLNLVPGLAEQVALDLASIKANGMKKAVELLLAR